MERFKTNEFYSFEGPEGSGKTTTLLAVKEELIRRNIPFLFTREPGGTPAAEAIRNVVFEHDLDSHTEILLMCAARKEHLEKVILPSIEKGMTVFSDRYNMSTAVYQFLLRGKNFVDFELSERMIMGEILYPKKTFLFDIPVDETLARLEKRGALNKYDKLDVEGHTKIRNAYLEIASLVDNVVVLNGLLSTKELVEIILKETGLIYAKI